MVCVCGGGVGGVCGVGVGGGRWCVWGGWRGGFFVVLHLVCLLLLLLLFLFSKHITVWLLFA